MEEALMKCNHYRRYCKILTPCCSKIYPCHVCHDDNEDHILNRFLINVVLCNNCTNCQEPNRNCNSCDITFGLYSCLLCFMFDYNLKGQFHCYQCGICRVGGEENYFHCKKCNMCLALRLRHNHTCIENCADGNCPLCGELLHTSRKELHVPKCGHLLHTECYDNLKLNNFLNCTVCRTKLT